MEGCSVLDSALRAGKSLPRGHTGIGWAGQASDVVGNSKAWILSPLLLGFGGMGPGLCESQTREE